jgi:hypothetical protein
MPSLSALEAAGRVINCAQLPGKRRRRQVYVAMVNEGECEVHAVCSLCDQMHPYCGL